MESDGRNNLGSISLMTKLSYSGTIEEVASITLRFSLPGTVERVLVAPGERVWFRELPATLNEASSRSALELVQVKLQQARSRLIDAMAGNRMKAAQDLHVTGRTDLARKM